MYVLEARSAMLAPPDTDLPKTAPPDAAAQHAMLAKAQDYAAKTYPQLPRLTATRLVARFQDGVETIHSYGGAAVKTVNDTDSLWDQISQHQYFRLMNTHTDTVELDNGIEKPGGKDTTQWGRNGFVNSMLPFLPLNLVTSEAVSSGNPKFLRWETVTGHKTAVFAFAVDKKKSRYAINYCWFPDTYYVANGLYNVDDYGNLSGGPAHPVDHGNLSDVSDWGLYVPVRSFTIAEIVPNGSSSASHYGVRRQIVTQDYKDFEAAGTTTAQK
jgi:hypothetical protein